jgi:hypothetical protein
MVATTQLIKRLRGHIGSQVIHNGIPCIVVELLEQPLCLVIEAIGARTTIQDNQFGRPQRLASRVFTIPCLSDDNSDCLHPALLALGLELQ